MDTKPWFYREIIAQMLCPYPKFGILQTRPSFRRVPTVAICTLAALAAQDLNHQTIAALPQNPAPEKAADFFVPVEGETPHSYQEPAAIESIASPSALVVPEFSQSSIRTVPASERDSSSKVVQQQVPDLAVATISVDVPSHLSPNIQALANQNNIQEANGKLPTVGEISPQQTDAIGQATEPAATEPSLEEIRRIQNQLQAVPQTGEFGDVLQGSPALTIVTPSGFGVDNKTGFISATYQARTRFNNKSDGAIGVGVGLGDARKSVGVELSYALASFGGSRDFGSGGFNVKVHRQLQPDLSVAAGWNGLLNIGDPNDFENSLYGVVTKVFRTRDDINLPLSRVAVSAGLGNGQFRSEDDVERDADSINPFGSVAVRVSRPVSLIAEWTGEDLGLGVSIVPFKNRNLVITPALRDIAGGGDGARFVLGAGYAFKF